MKMRRLGKSGLNVSAIGFGGMPLSIKSDRPSDEQAVRVIHAAVDCGINFIDTADAYCQNAAEAGHNERLIGRAIAELPPHVRDTIIVATKGGLIRPEGRWERDGTPAHLRAACEASLKALRTDRIRLYQYHRIDPKVPVAESMGELTRLQREGKIEFIGVSNFSIIEMQQARGAADFVSVQNEYSRKHRAPETDGTLRYALDNDLAFLPWSPLNGIGAAATLGRDDPLVESVAAGHGVSPQQVALAWLLHKGPHVIPIPGASRESSIRDSARAADLVLRQEEIHALDRAGKR